MLIKYLLVLATSLVILTSAVQVHSQTTEPTQPVNTVTLEQLKRDYFFQVEKYREAQEKFNFEKAEFQKLGTLASQEDALAAMKQLMIARARTMRTYLATVERQLWDANSLDPERKQEALDQIQLAQLSLKTQEEEVPNLFDKDNILSTSREFEERINQIYEPQYRGLSLIAINRVKSAFNNLVTTANDFENQIVLNIEDESFKAANLRGLAEVSELINNARSAIETAEAEYLRYDDPRTDRANQSSVYSQVVKELLPAHSAMQQGVTFLIELERGVYGSN